MKWWNGIFNNAWPKFITLALAVATWFYVFDLINSDSILKKRERTEEIFSSSKFVVKDVPVKPIFTGRTPEGYRVDFDKIKIDPVKIAIFGPEEIVGDITGLRTDKINLSEYTRSVKLVLPVRADEKFLRSWNKSVVVYVPIEPVPEKKPEALQQK